MQQPPGDAISAFLDATAFAAPDDFEGITLWPILRREPRNMASAAVTPHELLAEALARGSVVIDEVSDAGSVPNVRVRNAGDLAVLVLFGEELRGAKQNRIANASFLVPAHGEVVIDVSCVEAGRWRRARDARFEATASLVSQKLRAKMARSVAASRSRGGRFTADQGEVWEEVARRLDRSGAHSPTAAYAAYADRYGDALRRVRGSAPALLPHQIGFIAAIRGGIAGIEVLADPRVFAACFGRLLDAYVVDALDPAEDEPAAAGDLADFVAALSRATRRASPSLGLGEDVRLESPALLGCALVAGSVVHLSAAPLSASR